MSSWTLIETIQQQGKRWQQINEQAGYEVLLPLPSHVTHFTGKLVCLDTEKLVGSPSKAHMVFAFVAPSSYVT